MDAIDKVYRKTGDKGRPALCVDVLLFAGPTKSLHNAFSRLSRASPSRNCWMLGWARDNSHNRGEPSPFVPDARMPTSREPHPATCYAEDCHHLRPTQTISHAKHLAPQEIEPVRRHRLECGERMQMRAHMTEQHKSKMKTQRQPPPPHHGFIDEDDDAIDGIAYNDAIPYVTLSARSRSRMYDPSGDIVGRTPPPLGPRTTAAKSPPTSAWHELTEHYKVSAAPFA